MGRSSISFDATFKALTGHSPFPWQAALHKRFLADDFPTSCAIPTGLGKTNVITIWLIALAEAPIKIPRRLVYVVNRRTVVDQATREVEKLRENLKAVRNLADRLNNLCAMDTDIPLAISTLRGQFADNGEWSADPARPAVIVGTVDMIGSRLLFSGYGRGFKTRPLHAGFLGQDALLVHDEAHLEPAFQKLLIDIEKEQREGERSEEVPWLKLRVMELTATSREDKGDGQAHKLFELTKDEQKPPAVVPDPPSEPIHHVWRRLKAKKELIPHPIADEKKTLADRIGDLAIKYSDSHSGSAVLVFLRKLEDVEKVIKKLPKGTVEQLTGTMRGLERDSLVKSPIFQRFLPPSNRDSNIPATEGTVYLVCTSAGEVGIDISADHMVCDLSTFESMAQRFGRVNRFGDRDDTRIDVVYPASFGKTDKKSGESKADEIEKRRQQTHDLLCNLPNTEAQDENGNPIYDASPKALGELRDRTDLPCKIDDAFSPTPKMLDATDILFDAWAMTTIRENLPGRPPVAPYLHGIADDLPRTTVAWRAELDLIDAKFVDAEKTIHAIFMRHRIRPHETLTTNSYRMVDFLKKVVKKRPDLSNTRVAIQLNGGLRLTTVDKLIGDPRPLSADPTLILPAGFGGLDDKGMLSIDAVPKANDAQDESDNADGEEDSGMQSNDDAPSATLDIADHDGYEPYTDVPTRIRVLIERSDDCWSARAMPGGKSLPAKWQLEPSYDKSTQLIDHLRKQSGLLVRLVQPVGFNDEGDPACSLVLLSPAPPHKQREEQSLDEHVAAVECEAQRLAGALKLKEPYRSALLFAAKWHDEGKKADRWQRYIGGPDANGQPLGKSAKWRNPKLLAGYRHEFGSLLRIPNEELHRDFADPERNLTTEQQEQTRELALHLIAAHHGYARPHFANPLDNDFNTTDCEKTHIDVIRRFARLQRKSGRWGLAYLESLLRAADYAASRAVGLDPETDDDDPNGADA